MGSEKGGGGKEGEMGEGEGGRREELCLCDA